MPARRKRSASRSRSFDGYLHEKDARFVLNVVLCLSVIPLLLTIAWGYAWQVALGLTLGALCGYAVTPDADHMATTHEEYRNMRKWGIFGALLMGYMTPYAFLFSHRSKGSHSIFPGTPIRILWVTWPILIFAVLVAIEFNPLLGLFYLIMPITWSIQDMFHYRRDGLGWLGLSKRRIPKRA